MAGGGACGIDPPPENCPVMAGWFRPKLSSYASPSLPTPIKLLFRSLKPGGGGGYPAGAWAPVVPPGVLVPIQLLLLSAPLSGGEG